VVPGFGHGSYRQGDPRVGPLRAVLARVAPPGELALLDELVAVAADHELDPPNVDLALGALARAIGLDRDGVGVVFSFARCAGWVAHYLEELDEQPLRFRARAVYVR
jgi:citrate synthase